MVLVAWCLRRPFGGRAAWFTGLLFTISPLFLYYGRFQRMDLLEDERQFDTTEVERRGWPYRGSRPETGSRYIFVKDPDGYDIEILQAN